MAGIDDTLNLIREAHAELKTPELARLADVPYTTVHEASKRGFEGPAVETLRKLEAAARAHRLSKDAGSAAA